MLLWEHTINIHGKLGCNVPMDLHIEHVNKHREKSMGNLGFNISEKSVSRIGRVSGGGGVPLSVILFKTIASTDHP